MTSGGGVVASLAGRLVSPFLTGSLGSSVAVSNGGTFAAQGGKITGNYSTDSGSTTALQIGNGLTVTGTASLDGTLKLLAEASGYSVKPTETLLTAGSVTGTFDSLTYGSGVFWSAVLGYTPTTSIDVGVPNFVRWYRAYHGV